MRTRDLHFVFDKDGKLISSFRFAWIANLVAWIVGGSVRVNRGLLGRSARCRIDGGRKMTRCVVLRTNAKRAWVRLPNGSIINRRLSWIVQ